MKKFLVLSLLGFVFAAGSALAADPVVGTWTFNPTKSKVASSPRPTAGTRVYTETDGLYMLDQKLTGKDGMEMPLKVQYQDGKDEPVTGVKGIDSIHAKKLNADTWDFSAKLAGKEVGHVHRTVSADGKTLTVHNTGKQPSGSSGDDTLVFDKQ